MKTIEYQCFTRLIEEVFKCAQLLKKDTPYTTHELNKLLSDLQNTVVGGTIAISTLRNHLKIQETAKLPRNNTLTIYCQYCRLKDSTWCRTDNWHQLLEQFSPPSPNNEPVQPIVTSSKRMPEPTIFVNVWYRSEPYKFWDFWRSSDEGVLFIDFGQQEIRFESVKTPSLTISKQSIVQLIHDKMPGDPSNSWSRLLYTARSNDKQVLKHEAWFQEKSTAIRGFDNLVGGGEALYKKLAVFLSQ